MGSRSPVMTMVLVGAASDEDCAGTSGGDWAVATPWIAIAPSAVMTQGILRFPRMALLPNNYESFRPEETFSVRSILSDGPGASPKKAPREAGLQMNSFLEEFRGCISD
jgi:hypothetical protein